MDWSELPQDLLHLIAKKLDDLSHFIRFRSVCKKWRDSSPLSDPPSQLPWSVTDRKNLPNTIQFYSLSSRKIHSIVLNEIKGKRILGSSQNYMLVFDRKSRSLSLLNPFTRREIFLPCTDSNWHRPVYIGPDLNNQNGDDVVICWNSSGILTIGSCRAGRDKEWKIIIQIPQGSYGQTYYKGMYYVNERETMITRAINLSTGSTEFIVPPMVRTGQPSRLDYLINSSDEILGVYGGKWTSRVIQDYKFEIYKLEFDCTNEVHRWIKIDGIGDRILFLDDTIGFCLKASEHQGFEGNCIYFIAYIYPEFDGFYEYPFCKYDLRNGRTEKVVRRGAMNMSSWFFPSLS